MRRTLCLGVASLWLTAATAVGGTIPGKIVGWGSNDSGQLNTPSGDNFVAVAAGGLHGVALRFDGSLVAWGSNIVGQRNVPPGNNFVAISAGLLHSLALRDDGTIVGWGTNNSGQTNVPAGNDFVAVAAGSDFSAALRSNGTIVAWGSNDFGQRNVPAGNTFTEIDAGGLHGLALRSDGSLAGWGLNVSGQLNVPLGNNFTAVSAGPSYSLALRSNGTIAGWGSPPAAPSLPGHMPTGNDFVAIEASQNHSLALRSDGSLYAWGGSNTAGQLNVPAGDNFVAISAGAPGGLVSSSYNLAIQIPEPDMPIPVGDGFFIAFSGVQTAGPGAIAQTPLGVSHSLSAESSGDLVRRTNRASRSFVFNPDDPGGDPVSISLGAKLDGALTADVGGMASVEASIMVRDMLGQVIGSDSRMLNTGPGSLAVAEQFNLPLMLTPGATYEMLTTLTLAAQNGTADFANTFTVEFVPEPASASLALFAAAIACLRRKTIR